MSFRQLGQTLTIGLGMTLAVVLATPAAAQATIGGDLLKDWQNQKDTMIKIADAMPEDKFGYRSTPPQRTYGEQIMHIAQANVQLAKLTGGKTPAPTFTPETTKIKAQILKALGDSYDYNIALIKEHGEAGLAGTVKAAFLGEATRARVFWTLLAHSMDIYGQMAVYLRLNGIVPPASRQGI